MDVYVMKDGKRLGPFPPFLLKEMLEDGRILPGDAVWHEGMDNWQPLEKAESLRVVFPSPSRGEEEGEEEEASPAGVPPARRPPPVPGSVRAGSRADAMTMEITLALLRQRRGQAWRRFFARQIDGFLAVMVVTLTAAAFGWTDFWALLVPPAGWVHLLAPALIWIILEALMLSTLGWTPGKLVLGLRVLDREGRKPTLPAALKRSVLVWAGGLAFGLGMVIPPLTMAQWLFGLWHVQRTGGTLWDRSAGTLIGVSDLRRENAAGVALITAVAVNLATWVFLCVPVPDRITGEDRKACESMRRGVWKLLDLRFSAPSPVPAPAAKSGLPTAPAP